MSSTGIPASFPTPPSPFGFTFGEPAPGDAAMMATTGTPTANSSAVMAMASSIDPMKMNSSMMATIMNMTMPFNDSMAAGQMINGGITPMPMLDAILAVQRKVNYPHQLWWAIASFIGLISIFQFLSFAIGKLSGHERRRADPEGAGVVVRRFSVLNFPTALVNLYRVVAFRLTIEIGQSYTLNLAEVLITCGYIAALFTWEFINTTNLEGKKFDPAYYSDRAALLAASQFPLVTALGTKNNIVAYITGISYDKLNYIHRMMARVVFVLLWVHAGSKIYNVVNMFGGNFDPQYARLGLLAIIAYTVLIIVSLRPIRSRAYEVFFFTHFAMVLIMLVGGYFHARLFMQTTYIWPSFIIWGLDRLIRVFRVVYFNNWYFQFGPRALRRRLDASVELVAPQFVRLHIHRPPPFKWTPGQTAFLIMPAVSGNPLEAHPFTIASVDAHHRLAGSSMGDHEKMDKDDSPYWSDLIFIIQVREGFTKRLASVALLGEKVPVLVDGPYGFSPNLKNDDTVVLVATGSGASLAVSTFLGVLYDVQNKKSKTSKLVFIWSIRSASHIELASHALAQALERAPSGVEIDIRLFVTSKAPLDLAALMQAQRMRDNGGMGIFGELTMSETMMQESMREGSMGDGMGDSMDDSMDDATMMGDESMMGDQRSLMEKPMPTSFLMHSSVKVTQGRPDIRSLLLREVDISSGRMSVTVCGSQAVARLCRKALRLPMSTQLKGGPSVVLHVESFGYA